MISVAVWLKIAAELYTKKPASHLVLEVVFSDKIAIQQVDGGVVQWVSSFVKAEKCKDC